MGNTLRRIKGGSSVAVLTLTAVLALGTLVAAAPANAAGPVGSSLTAVVDAIPGSISGKVTGLSSTGVAVPLADVWVSVSGIRDGFTTTDSLGRYSLASVPPGDHVIQFSDHSSTRARTYAPAEKVVTIASSRAMTLDIMLKPGSVIVGTLTKTVAGVVSPAPHVDVVAHSLDGSEVAWASTDDNGKYRVGGMAAGTYKVRFGFYAALNGLLVPEYFSDVYTLAAAKPLIVGAGASVTGINAQLTQYVSSATPTITGKKQVGYTLTANPGTWGPGTVSFKYQWYRSGVAITGATLKTYTLTNTDAADTMKVKVTGSKTGYSSRTKTSAATVAIAAGLTAPTPTITGTKKVGYTLTANPGTWGPGTVTLKYQWYRSGVAISGGTAKTYKLVSADRYDTIKVRVLGIKTGYADVAKYSASTVKIP